jgi:HlyD family secretion protein
MGDLAREEGHIMRKILIAILIIAALCVIGYFGYQVFKNRQQTNSISSLETVTASQGSLTATVGATGTVRPDQSAIIPWQTSGNVDQVNVEVGHVITSGQTLASLIQSSLPQNVILAQSDLITSQKQLDDLQNTQSASKQALLTVNTSQQAVYDAQRALVRFDQKPYKDQLEKANNTVVDKKDALDQAQKDFDPYKDWDPSNTTRQNYEQKLTDAQIAYDEAVRQVDELELQKQTAQSNLDAANAALADAQRAYDQVKNGPNPDDIAVLQTRIAAAQATLDNAKITAPFAGTISSIEIKPGDQVTIGTPAFRLDNLGRLLVDVQVSEVDINTVKVGQPVTLSFDAIQDKQYAGIVSQVAPVGDVLQGVVNFAVTVELTDADENVKPGMTAAVNIIVNQLTNVLLVPNRAVRVVNGKQVVYILDNGQLTEVEVVLGASSDSQSEVIGGNLQVGDQIVLNPPQNLLNMGGPFGG